MQIKTFRAPTIALALDQVKKDLGPDAIILGNKQVTVSPNEAFVEVTAAVEPETSRKPTSALPAHDNDIQIQEDIQEIKGFLSLLISSKNYLTDLQTQKPVAEVYHGLLTRGFDEKQAYILLSKALADLKGDYESRNLVIDSFCRHLLEKVKLVRPFQHVVPSRNTVGTFSFLGPTGVGKTTTLAKLAAHLKIKRNARVGIISIDTYRIGAVDQLQTYATILGIPLIVAQSRAEFNDATKNMGDLDVILVDTTGRNFLNRQHVEDLKPIFADNRNIQHFLVLSATAKDADLKQTIAHFREMNIHSLIFTKVDETMTHGCMVNQLLRFPYPLSYVGTGQRVPEDLELMTQKRLLSFLFSIKR
jgi:flagellar biosynthesis protein FlhF